MRSRVKYLVMGVLAVVIAAVLGYDLVEQDISTRTAVVAEEPAPSGDLQTNPSSSQVAMVNVWGIWRLR